MKIGCLVKGHKEEQVYGYSLIRYVVNPSTEEVSTTYRFNRHVVVCERCGKVYTYTSPGGE